MKTAITISCEDKRELMLHLQVLIEQLEQVYDEVVDEGFELEDHNCYGDHYLKVIE